ncbi:hypothetical protein OPQ81_008506 [Rhizoctonia solani]|nr:hypothetical protein OPQ81_008506 [Rhizoctonia solani]
MDNGVYTIHCVDGRRGVWIPNGAPLMAPVQCSNHAPPTPIRIQRIGGNVYRLFPLNAMQGPGEVVLGAHSEAEPAMVILAPSGTGEAFYTEWAIDHNGTDSDGNDQYEIHPTTGPGNQYWTETGEGTPIELKGSRGEEAQQWVFKHFG